MNRLLQPELLDELPSTDPRAIHSRRDLRRLNKIMRNAHHLIQFLVGTDGRRFCNPSRPITLLELGAGDGNISSQIIKSLSSQGIFGRVLLIDRQPVVKNSFQSFGWKHEVIEADIFDWLPSAPPIDITIANLFLHHFTGQSLRQLFSHLTQITQCFAACEPRRSRFAQWFARKVWMIGCNRVTLHDAEISVQAGFTDTELTLLWPHATDWRLTEHPVGLFSHFFAACQAPRSAGFQPAVSPVSNRPAPRQP